MELFDEIINRVQQVLWVIMMVMLILLIVTTIRTVARADTYECVVHKGEWVWIRSGPNYEAPQVGQLRYGYQVEVDGFENNFAHIRFKDIDGYVAAQYLELPIRETMYRVITEGGPLAKRETPAGRLMTWIKSGSRISVLGWRYAADGSMWARVYKGGYVKASYLALE